jgi:serine/threonine protein kinase/tetratricopeptide (TPR) repeat protein
MGAGRLDIKSIFGKALALATPQERAAYLQEACAGDAVLRAEVESLLQAHQDADAFLNEAQPSLTVAADGVVCERPGSVIGPYTLREEIGAGGMGLVFVAEQTQPVRRKVALKVIKPGMDTRQVIARFEAERQALALMDHPNIAKVHDGGATAAGRPYFVMELVKGVPITQFCDENRLNTRERLALFVSVCQAVQHAHQKGIIHRDLKPSNVLVTVHDTTPVAKVIDFGVAKAIGQQLTDKTVYTQMAQMIGTPLYMSPEQAGQSGLDIDTRSDIYALGVLLYELLTGTTPFDEDRLRKASYDELVRIIREEEPPRPSTRISTLGQAAATVSAQRQSDPRRLSQLFRGELDWVVMKCLEKDRNRRYETAGALALDVERYLRDEPVEACPPSAGYRLRKFARRNKGPVLAGCLILLTLLGGLTGTTLGLVQAENAWREEIGQRRAAEKNERKANAATAAEREAKELAQKRLEQIKKANEILFSIFRDLKRGEAASEGLSLRAQLAGQLNQAVALLEGEAIGDPVTMAVLQVQLGAALDELGYPQRAIEVLTRARPTLETHLGPAHYQTLCCLNNLGKSYLAAGQATTAVALLEQVLAKRQATLGPDSPDTLLSMSNLALAYEKTRRLDRALPLFEQVLAKRQATLGPNHSDTLLSMNNLGFGLGSAGRWDRALPLFEQALQRRKVVSGASHHLTLTSMNNLAGAYRATRQSARALPLLEEVLAKRAATLGPQHPQTLTSLNNLAAVYQEAGKPDKALPLLEQAVAKQSAALGLSHPSTLNTLSNLALTYRGTGQIDRALPLLEQALERRKEALGPRHPDTLKSLSALAQTCGMGKQYTRAAKLWQTLLAAQDARLPRDHPDRAETLYALGQTLLVAGQAPEAAPVLRECLTIFEQKKPDHWETFAVQSLLGHCLLTQKSYAEAEKRLLAGYQGLKRWEGKMPLSARFQLTRGLERIVQLYDAWGKKADAARWRKVLEAHTKKEAERGQPQPR